MSDNLGSIELNRIYQMDCLEGMKLIPDKSIDMVLCDLPYGTTECSWDSVIPFDQLWTEYERLIKDDGALVFTASQPFTTTLISSNQQLYKYSWVWVKTRSTDFVNAKNKPMKKHEDIVIFSKGTTANKSNRRMKYNPQGLIYNPSYQYRPTPKMKDGGVVGERPSHVRGYTKEWTNYPHSVLDFANPNNHTLHPTQKPVDLFEYLIKTYTDDNGIVLDNCIGSGTTAVAAIKSNRRFIGFETDPKYVEIANIRIDAAYQEEDDDAIMKMIKKNTKK